MSIIVTDFARRNFCHWFHYEDDLCQCFLDESEVSFHV